MHARATRSLILAASLTVVSGGAVVHAAEATEAPPPDLSRLRVSTAGWATDFSRASVDLGDFLGGSAPRSAS